MSCCDVRERFHLLVLLLTVNIQTMKELNWAPEGFWTMLPDCICIFLAEFGVDWVKHAFVTRFNEISYEVYHQYTISIAYDLASSKLKSVSTSLRLHRSKLIDWVSFFAGIFRPFRSHLPSYGLHSTSTRTVGLPHLFRFRAHSRLVRVHVSFAGLFVVSIFMASVDSTEVLINCFPQSVYIQILDQYLLAGQSV